MGTNVGRELGARAPQTQLLTPERYRLLMRFQLWQQAVKNGLETTDSLERMSTDFNCAKTLPYRLAKRFGDRDTLSTASRSGRPKEWTDVAVRRSHLLICAVCLTLGCVTVALNGAVARLKSVYLH